MKITKNKLLVFKKIKGDVDIRFPLRQYGMASSDIYEIKNILQDLFLMHSGKLSKEYEENLMRKLENICDNEETKTLFLQLGTFQRLGTADK